MSLKTGLNVRQLIYETLVHGVDVQAREELWDCTSCTTCVTRCPKGLNPTDFIIGLRSVLVENGRIPPSIRDALKSIFTHGNPLAIPRDERSAWAEGLEIKSASEDVDVVYFVGCTPAYDPRVQKVARAMVKVLDKAGVSFGTLGNDESCCGSQVRRVGEEGLFEMLVEDNLEVFKEYDVQRMVTLSPHCYNVFKNEYEGLDFEVQHYTQFMAGLIEGGQLTFSGMVEKVVTYQDPCFLGKQNKIFDEPRKILRSIPGVEFRDLDRSRERSLCCEGGGGRMWVEGTNVKDRLAQIRIEDAIELGAEILATACPFCLLTLEDAVKVGGYEKTIRVMDLIELVAQAI